MFNIFDHITSIYLIFLLYGATFLFLGVSIAAKDMKGSDLQLADSLWMLGAFGFLHGTHEWMELGPLIEGENLPFRQLFLIKAVSTSIVVLSFLFLLWFGISLIRVLGDRRFRWAKAVPLPLIIIWTLYVWYFGFRSDGHFDMQTIRQANIGARYTFGFVGGMMAAYGLVAYSREMRNLSRSTAQKLYFAGIAFGLYAVFAGLLSSWYRVPVIEVPIVVFRGLLGIIITYLMTKALNIFDIEARKKIEQQTRSLAHAEKLTSLGQLAAGIAHEINNPLTNASLAAQTLMQKMKRDGAEQWIMEKLDTVERNIDKASVIARELLQFSRQKEIAFTPCNISRVINGALTLLHYRLSNITVHHISNEVPDVMGDPVKLEQVFINILSNAVEAMPEGGEITFDAAQKQDKVEVQISDTGPGIRPEHLSRVFDPFFTTKELGIGTGLGLSISYGIVRQHHGTIELSSKTGKGTTVTVRLPTKERYDELYEKSSDR